MNRRVDKWKDVPIWMRSLWIIAILNFVGFAVVAGINGGDAVNGKEEGGKYFVANHGRHTEVSKAFFQYSRIHVYSIWITHPAAILGAFWYTWRKKKMIAL